MSYACYPSFLGIPFEGRPTLEEIRAALRGKDLACDCHMSQPCHADVLIEIANTPVTDTAGPYDTETEAEQTADAIALAEGADIYAVHEVEADGNAPVLVPKSLAALITFWRPGSHEWSWAEEYADIMARPETKAICARVDSEGIGFLDHLAPVLLGSDGRVWDGHHRICIAIQRGYPSLMVEIAGSEKSA